MNDKIKHILMCLIFVVLVSIFFINNSQTSRLMNIIGDILDREKIIIESIKLINERDEYIKSEMEKEKDFHKKEWIDPGINDTGSQKPDTYFNSDWGIIEEPEEILFEFTTGGVLKDNYKPQLFLKITGTDLSRCFIDGRLRVDLNGEIYWIRLEK